MDPRFEPGRTILRRYYRADRIAFLNVARVIGDDDRGLRIWYPAGAPYWRIVDAAGRTEHDISLAEMQAPRLAGLTWQGSDVLVLMPPGAAHSVWWFFAAGTGDFQGWYGNLESPCARWDDGGLCGVDTADQELDLRLAPDGSCQWKDVAEFEGHIGAPGYWTATEAAEIRAEGERLAKRAEARTFPFDGTWTDFRPDPSWSRPHRLTGWDRPRVR